MSQIEPAVSKRFVADPHPAGRRVQFPPHKSLAFRISRDVKVVFVKPVA